jgi:hypothetical protein
MLSSMTKHPDKNTLLAAYRLQGFCAKAQVESYAHEPPAFVITFERVQKKRYAAVAAKSMTAIMTNVGDACAIFPAVAARSILILKCGACGVGSAA